MKKYCCGSFRTRFETNREMGLNIRITKLTKKEVISDDDLIMPFRFFITEGYELGQLNVKMVLIKFCPFCGEKLEDQYSSDQFVNEDVMNLNQV